MDLDRAATLRTHQDEIEAMLRGGEAWLLPLWRHRNLVEQGEGTRLVRLEHDPALVAAAHEVVFLGKLGARPCFAIGLPGDDAAIASLSGRGDFNDLRMAGPFMELRDAELAAYARGIIYWHRHHQHCGKCGAPTQSADAGHARLCAGCHKKHFPRTDPAVMALIIDGDRCVLARQPRFPPSMFSILAGFVEPGESLETAVAREVREEVGLEVTDVRYVRSQSWPFPSSLMLGFAMRAVTTDIHLDDEELEEARWVSRDQIVARDGLFVPPTFSLAGQLISLFVAGEV